MAEVCTEARHREIPSPFLAIVDRSKVCFAPHAGSINEYGIIVEDRTHAFVFHWFFLSSLWDVWEPLYAPDPEGPPLEFSDVRYCIREITPHLKRARRFGSTSAGSTREPASSVGSRASSRT